jgi:hypothetical protein
MSTKEITHLETPDASYAHPVASKCNLCELEHWPDFSHCPDCHFTWPISAHALCHCAACHESFSTDTSFLAHQDRLGSCRNPAEIPDLTLRERRYGSVWGRVWNEGQELPEALF